MENHITIQMGPGRPELRLEILKDLRLLQSLAPIVPPGLQSKSQEDAGDNHHAFHEEARGPLFVKHHFSRDGMDRAQGLRVGRELRTARRFSVGADAGE